MGSGSSRTTFVTAQRELYDRLTTRTAPDLELTGEDLTRLRLGRLARVREEMARREIAACVLVDPVNIRYATDARNMQVFMLRNPARYLFLPLEGPVVLYEFKGCHHLARGLETIDEIRPAANVSYVAAGPRLEEVAGRWVDELSDEITRRCGRGVRVGLERVNRLAGAGLAARGFTIVDAQEPVERARARKLPEELVCVKASIAATQTAVERMREGIRPGASEQEVWGLLHQAVIAEGGDYVETRLLSSGPRTNPWYQEAGERPLRSGELVALDTDVVGRYGYYADLSRTFFCGLGRPTDEQRRLYDLAVQQVETNLGLVQPGITFRELAARAWRIPDEYVANRYFVLAHGVGMTGEYPNICHVQDFDRHGYDGVLEEGMTICIESYIGADGGREGVKLEQQVLVTDDGYELLSTYPYEETLLAR